MKVYPKGTLCYILARGTAGTIDNTLLVGCFATGHSPSKLGGLWLRVLCKPRSLMYNNPFYITQRNPHKAYDWSLGVEA